MIGIANKNRNKISYRLRVIDNKLTQEIKFYDILNFRYTEDFGCPGYFLEANRYNKFGGELENISYILGKDSTDYIDYGDVRYYTADFPKLAQKIHNRNIERELDSL